MKTNEAVDQRNEGGLVERWSGRPCLGLHWEVEPWPETVAGEVLLNELEQVLRRFVVLPNWGGYSAGG